MTSTTTGGLTVLQGQIERVTYTNEENGYTIARVKVYGRRDLVTVIGNMVNPTPGEIVRMEGAWGTHPKYGEQFRIVHCRSTTPATVHGIEKYLGSGLIKGIGPVMARRIVKRFREETLDVIEKDIERLAEVDGVGEKRIDMIRRAWAEQKEIREVMVFLQSHGVSTAYGAKIYKQYGGARSPFSGKTPNASPRKFSASVLSPPTGSPRNSGSPGIRTSGPRRAYSTHSMKWPTRDTYTAPMRPW